MVPVAGWMGLRFTYNLAQNAYNLEGTCPPLLQQLLGIPTPLRAHSGTSEMRRPLHEHNSDEEVLHIRIT